MTLGDCIKEYREENDLSQREFAKVCNLSNAYISNIEKGINPKTGETFVPSIYVYHKIARAMGITLQELMERAPDSQVALLPIAKNEIDTIDHALGRDPAPRTDRDTLMRWIPRLTDGEAEKILAVCRAMYPDKFREES